MFTVKFSPGGSKLTRYSIKPGPALLAELLAELPVSVFSEAKTLYNGKWSDGQEADAAANRLNDMLYTARGIGYPDNLDQKTHYYYLITNAGPLKKISARYLGEFAGGYVFLVGGETVTLRPSEVEDYIRTNRFFRAK